MRRVIAAAAGLFALFIVAPNVSDADTCVLSRTLKVGYCVNLPALPDPTAVK